MSQPQGITEDNYGISRVDDDNHCTHAWRVSLCRYGRRHVKNFPDKKYGSRSQALEGAQIFRDEFLLTHPPISRKEVCSTIRSNNSSGITGVCTYAKRHRRRDNSVKENWYWEASWPNERGESIKSVFSVNTYGDTMARQMAIRARLEGIEALQGAFWASERGLVKLHIDSAEAAASSWAAYDEAAVDSWVA
ncbi:MAG: hypothetical protein ACI9DH_001106 [Halioglobus sp.]|jgi:hypothetical protein